MQTMQQISNFDQLKSDLKKKIINLTNLVRPYGEPKTIFRIEMPCQNFDLFQWLEHQTIEKKIYWSNRDGGIQIAGLGTVDHIKGNGPIDYEELFEHFHQRFNSICPNVRYYGGLCFDPQNMDTAWQPFGTYQFFIPRFECVHNGSSSTFACNIAYNEIERESLSRTASLLNQVQFFPEKESLGLQKPKALRQEPDQEQWNKIFGKVHEILKSGELQKIVLARKSVFNSDKVISAFLLKRELKKLTPECYHFCFQPNPDTAFIGASPERLFKRQDQHIESEAIAGTRPRGQTESDDQRFRDELLGSSKDLAEHKIVVDAIAESLQGHCHSITFDEKPSTLKLIGSHHLKTALRAHLKEGVNDFQLLKSLHPTPAVAGYPTHQALELIKKYEPFARGWYAGVFGSIGSTESEFTVAIRSGLIQKNTISLFSGAGILPESQQDDEWNEIENKMKHFFTVFEK